MAWAPTYQTVPYLWHLCGTNYILAHPSLTRYLSQATSIYIYKLFDAYMLGDTYDLLMILKHRRINSVVLTTFTGEFPLQRSVTRSFDVFFDLRLNKLLGNLDTGGLRRHHTHYDVTVIFRHWLHRKIKMTYRQLPRVRRKTLIYHGPVW